MMLTTIGLVIFVIGLTLQVYRLERKIDALRSRIHHIEYPLG